MQYLTNFVGLTKNLKREPEIQMGSVYMKRYIESLTYNKILHTMFKVSNIYFLCHTERERERERERRKITHRNCIFQFFVLFILHPHSWDFNLRNKIFSDMLSFILFQTLSFLNLYTSVLCCLQYYAVHTYSICHAAVEPKHIILF